MPDVHGESEHVFARVLVESIVVACGVLILALVAAAGPDWFDRHFLPDFFKDQSHRLHVADRIRVAILSVVIVAGLVLRPRAGRLAAREGVGAVLASALRIGVALVLALLVCEGVLRTQAWRARHASPVTREPLQQADARLGWVLMPGRVGVRDFDGRKVEYALDPSGFRVRCATCAIDFERDSVLFAGESIVLGTGLDWVDTLPAQVESATGHQGVNLAVDGYGTDQVYLRVADQWPRFRRPVALVALCMPSLLSRNFDRDRPWLDEHLAWHPARVPWRLEALFDRLIRYASAARVEEGIRRTRAALTGMATLAHRDHARFLVLEPRFPDQSPIEDVLRHRLFDGLAIERVQVPLDPAWRLSALDDHPDVRGSHAMGAALVARLQGAAG
jgi:hypothetical protein